MVKGTTAQFKFDLPYEYRHLSVVEITFWQEGNNNESLPIIKRLYDCTPCEDPYSLYVSLTQRESLCFSDKRKGNVQLRAQASDGNVFASVPKQFTVYPIYDDSVLDEGGHLPDDDDNEGWVILDGLTIGEVGD